MRDLTVWKNEQFKQMKAELDRLFREFSRDFGTSIFDEIQGVEPFTDISETADALHIKIEFPEMDPADINIAASAEAIIIEGSTKESRASKGQRLERSRQFSHHLRLPCRILPEKVEAVYKDHVLDIVLPKCHAAVFKKIPVRPGETVKKQKNLHPKEEQP